MENYLISVALKKGAWAIAKGIAAFVVSDQALKLESQFGIHLDPATFQAAVGSAIFAGLHMIHDYLRMRFPNVKWI